MWVWAPGGSDIRLLAGKDGDIGWITMKDVAEVLRGAAKGSSSPPCPPAGHVQQPGQWPNASPLLIVDNGVIRWMSAEESEKVLAEVVRGLSSPPRPSGGQAEARDAYSLDDHFLGELARMMRLRFLVNMYRGDFRRYAPGELREELRNAVTRLIARSAADMPPAVILGQAADVAVWAAFLAAEAQRRVG